MLKDVLFALLLVGYACAYQDYNKNSIDEYEGKGNTREDLMQIMLKEYSNFNVGVVVRFGLAFEFPPFEVMGKNWLFEFLVKREGEYGLVFETRPSEDQVFFLYDEIKEVVELESFKFEYSKGYEIRLHLRFKSMNSKKRWTVISRVFDPPISNSSERELLEHAHQNAVFPHSPTQDDVAFMKDTHGTYGCIISLDVKWVVDVFTFKPPKFDHIPADEKSEKIYRGVPLIYKFVLASLGSLQKRIHLIPANVSPYVNEVTKDTKK